MRVPVDPHNPTFDQTFNVPAVRWFTAPAADRREWARRRSAAARTSSKGQWDAHRQTAAERQQRIAERHPAPQPQVRHAAQPAPPVDAEMRNLNRLTKVGIFAGGVELFFLLGGVVVALVAAGIVLWIFLS